jgi:hypothetical protein
MVGRGPERRVDLKKRLADEGPRKLLAIDGGGIRGVLSLQILHAIEKLPVKESGRGRGKGSRPSISTSVSSGLDQGRSAMTAARSLRLMKSGFSWGELAIRGPTYGFPGQFV